MKGKRVTATHRAGRRLMGKGYRRREPVEKNGRPPRLLSCVVVLAVIVAIKFMFPQQFSAFTQSVSQIIGRNAGFAEAFAAVGRAVSGGEDMSESLQEAFLAAFSPSDVQHENTPADDEAQSQSASAAEGSMQSEESPQEQGRTEELSASGVYAMPSLPENASLDQRNLGFPCTTPVIGILSSAFGWREHPIEGGTQFHYGIDLAAEIGSEIVAFADGEVFAVGESSTLGKYIILLHPGGYKTLYAHCREVVIKSGSVKMGEVIACVGESGNATGPHLHFELQDGALYLNPIYYVAIW